MGKLFLFSLTAAFNPTLLAAVTIMLQLDRPKRLLAGYLLGAYTTSITLGLLIVFSLSKSKAVSTAKHTVNPVVDIVLGALLLLVAFVLATGRDKRLAERRRRRRGAKEKKEPRWKQALSQGSAKTTFVVGLLLSFPGGSYLAGLDQIVKLKAGTVGDVLLVIAFNLIALLLLELPLLGYAIAPDWTQEVVARFRAWLSRSGHRIAVIGAAAIGTILVARGVITLL